MYTISTEIFTADVFAYGENLICIDIKDGRKHTESGAILPLTESDSSFTEKADCFSINTAALEAEISKADCAIRFSGKDGNTICCT